MENIHFTNEARELFSNLSTDIYSLEQIFHDYPLDSHAYILAKDFVDSWHKLNDFITTE